MRHLIDLDQCIHEAIEYDDNCNKGEIGIGSQTSESMGRVSSQVDEILQGVTKRRQQMYGPPRVAKRDKWIGHTFVVFVAKTTPHHNAYLKIKVVLGQSLNWHCGVTSTKDGETIPQCHDKGQRLVHGGRQFRCT